MFICVYSVCIDTGQCYMLQLHVVVLMVTRCQLTGSRALSNFFCEKWLCLMSYAAPVALYAAGLPSFERKRNSGEAWKRFG